MLAASLAAIALHGHHQAAFAKGHDDDAGDDESSDEDDGKGDKEDLSSDGEDEDPEDAKNQPPVTAGGLFTLQTYPQNEILRPLTMTQKLTQVRLGVGTDLTAKGAFKSAGVSLEAIHGVTDNFSVIGGLTSAYNFHQYAVYAGFEGALAYDLIDFRIAANLHRFAIPQFCSNDPNPPAACDINSGAQPSGHYQSGVTQFSIDLGFPVRYAISDKIAIVALQTLMSIDFNGRTRGDPKIATALGKPAYCNSINAASTDANGNPQTADPRNCIENTATPDLNPSLGFATNPIPQLSLVIFAQLRIPDFDTSAGNFQVPVTARIEFSPSRQVDIGLEFQLLNVKPPTPQSPIDDRFGSLFAQARF